MKIAKTFRMPGECCELALSKKYVAANGMFFYFEINRFDRLYVHIGGQSRYHNILLGKHFRIKRERFAVLERSGAIIIKSIGM
ncbi:MAG: hypothetical protein GX765_04515 [Candidatus Moranbacteria bacterium]|nr:hypothetical protein [Sphingobacteriia bacterium]NLC31284.1 hypothetical protein [Candidatus Moranbacteria bacterium]